LGEKISAIGASWHSKCFKCRQCGEIFAQTNNQRVVEKEGFPYCEKCYDNQFGEKCGGCGRSVSGSVIKALNKSWHPDCFKCTGCGTKFTSPGVYNKGGKPYCKSCGSS